ncbi:MAG TPA: hypothetical protein PLP28_10740, partial [Flavobacteriales bacterium]|nr:hypothetical protein [Flavobacteriales bacterium]
VALLPKRLPPSAQAPDLAPQLRLVAHPRCRDEPVQVLAPWLLKHKGRIEIFYLHSYSPEINPVEVANADL